MRFNKEVFAANLRAARASLDMSQEELSKAAGVSKDAIVKYESGEGYTPTRSSPSARSCAKARTSLWDGRRRPDVRRSTGRRQ